VYTQTILQQKKGGGVFGGIANYYINGILMSSALDGEGISNFLSSFFWLE
jgi:hypothetical protein